MDVGVLCGCSGGGVRVGDGVLYGCIGGGVCVEAERERDPKIRVREERASGSFFSRVEI